LGDPSVDGRIILRWFLRKWEGKTSASAGKNEWKKQIGSIMIAIFIPRRDTGNSGV
jgi:hypothetical protein